MNYTEFGNTKERVSRLGFGCMRLPMKYSDGNMQVDEQASIAYGMQLLGKPFTPKVIENITVSA